MRKRCEDDVSGGWSDRGGLDGWTPADGPPTVEWLTAAVPPVRGAGEFTGNNAIQFRNTVYTHLARSTRLVVIDLRPITALPADGVVALVDIAYETGDAGIGLCLVAGLNEDHPVGLALRAAGVLDLFDVHPDPSAALRTLI